MKSSELMIGDLIYNHRKWICPVTAIDKDHVTVIAQHYGESSYRWEDVYPISLTKEILEKNGFKIISEDVYKISNDLFVLTDDSPYSLCNSFDIGYGDEYNYITEIRYVHELQRILKFVGVEKELEL